MFPRDLYEIVHLIGIALTMAALGATALHALEGGTRRGPRARRALVALYGGGLFLVLLGGFGMLARLGIARAGIAAFPGWLWAKLAVGHPRRRDAPPVSPARVGDANAPARAAADRARDLLRALQADL